MGTLINTYNRPIPKATPEGGCELVEVMAVLTQDAVGQYTVYIGFGDPKWVQEHGQKLTYTEALTYYPNLQPEDYRR